jgi:hypothetical protein
MSKQALTICMVMKCVVFRMKAPNEDFVCRIVLGGGLMYKMFRRNIVLRHQVKRKMLLGTRSSALRGSMGV